MKDLQPISSGSIINGRYIVQKVLGQGGFGRTYLVKDIQKFNEAYVLKEFIANSEDLEQFEKCKELFEREARVLNDLNHPQIPNFMGWFQEEEKIFLVQDYINGKTYLKLLKERKEENQLFSEIEIINLLKNILPILDYIHKCKIIHRDISPDNIMLPLDDGKPFLIDFGVVNNQVVTQVADNSESSPFSTRVGKQGYSPPEQILYGQCYPNSDFYALAVTALVLVTGKSPQDLFNPQTRQWEWEKYISLQHNLDRIIKKMLADVPEQRYQKAEEILAELNTINTEPAKTFVIPSPSNGQIPPVSPPPDIPPISNQDSQKNILIIVTIVLSLAVITIGGVAVTGKSCQLLNNCSEDKQSEILYQEAIKQGSRPTPTNMAECSFEDLEPIRQDLEKAIATLESIPRKSSVYDQANTTLKDYQSKLELLKEVIELKRPLIDFDNEVDPQKAQKCNIK